MKYDEYIYKTVRQWMGLDENDKSRDTEIDKLSSQEIFEAILEWNGIIGYGSRILQWFEYCFHVKIDDNKLG